MAQSPRPRTGRGCRPRGSRATGVAAEGDDAGGFADVRYAFESASSGAARLGFGASYLTFGLEYRF